MVTVYKNDYLLLIYTIIGIVIICSILSSLNVFFNKLIKKPRSLGVKKNIRKTESYELRVNSLNSINTINTIQPIILALLFLLFNIKITLLVPMVSSLQYLSPAKQCIVYIYIAFIMLSVYVKIAGNVITFYNNKKTKYV